MFLYPVGGIEWARGNDQTCASSIGFNAGDGITFTNVEGSGNDTSILTLAKRSNTGVAGLYIFKVDSEIETAQYEFSTYTIADYAYWPCKGNTYNLMVIAIA